MLNSNWKSRLLVTLLLVLACHGLMLVCASADLGEWAAIEPGSDGTDYVSDGDYLPTGALGSTPANVSLLPASGPLSVDKKLTFVCTYSDADGYADLADCRLIVYQTSTATGAIYVRYDCNTNLLYVLNDDGIGWTGGVAPGTETILSNSYITLHCEDTTVGGSENTLTINWSITVKSSMLGKVCGGWLYCLDQLGFVDIDRLATYTIVANQAPSNVSLTPTSGVIPTDVQQTYTSVHSDPDGYANLADCRLLINSTLSSVNAAYVLYDANANKLYVINDAGTGWIGGAEPGSATTISNSFMTLHCQQTTVTPSGNNLTVNWSITMKPTMAGKICGGWTYCKDDEGLTDGFDRFATYSIGRPPSNVSLTPTTGVITAGVQQTYTAVYSDADGSANLADCRLLINSTLTSVGAAYVMYDSNANRLYVINDAGTGWTGGIVPGTATTIQNSYVILHCQQTTVTPSGNNLTVNWSITMKPTMAGKVCGGWTYCRDDQGMTDGFDRFATYTIGQLPANVSLSPTSAMFPTSFPQTYTAVYSDPDGYANLADCRLLINSTLTSVGAAYVMYDCNANRLYVVNDSGTGWTGGIVPGTATTIQNSYVILHCQQTTVSPSGNNLTVNWSITVKPTMAGKTCGGWTYCRDAQGLIDGFDRFATYQYALPPD